MLKLPKVLADLSFGMLMTAYRAQVVSDPNSKPQVPVGQYFSTFRYLIGLVRFIWFVVVHPKQAFWQIKLLMLIRAGHRINITCLLDGTFQITTRGSRDAIDMQSQITGTEIRP